jgi:hypothetical protein
MIDNCFVLSCSLYFHSLQFMIHMYVVEDPCSWSPQFVFTFLCVFIVCDIERKTWLLFLQIIRMENLE